MTSLAVSKSSPAAAASGSDDASSINDKIKVVGDHIRNLKAQKASKVSKNTDIETWGGYLLIVRSLSFYNWKALYTLAGHRSVLLTCVSSPRIKFSFFYWNVRKIIVNVLYLLIIHTSKSWSHWYVPKQ